jgi:ATP-dependent RNA helicase DDX51/DBP6
MKCSQVIDEADRLVTEAFQDWLAQVLAATRPAPSQTHPEATASGDHLVPLCDALHPAWIPYSSRLSTVTTDIHETKHPSCQKLLFSATLTRDPSKIAALNLTDPKYFVVSSESAVGISESGDGAVGEKFAFPAGLKVRCSLSVQPLQNKHALTFLPCPQEHMLVCDTSQKPLMLLYLVHARRVTNALVFTKSAESTARLVKLIQAFEQSLALSMDVDPKSETSGIDKITVVASAYSSDLSASQRKMILERFRNAEIGMCVRYSHIPVTRLMTIGFLAWCAQT